MNTTEFSSQFDIYYDSIASHMAPTVDEYEKSVFLTNAQRDLVVDIYTGRINLMSFESTEEARRYLAPLVVSLQSKPLNRINQKDPYIPEFNVAPEGQVEVLKKFPEDVCYIVMEYCTLPKGAKCLGDNKLEVVPITHDELLRTLNNPFRGMTDRRILRVDENNLLYLYSNQDLDKYNIVYVKKPDPIILTDLSIYGDYATIEGKQEETDCELPEIFHREILNRAVNAAKQAYMNIQQQVNS